MTDPTTQRAARNNAEWCDLVCRLHGVRTRFDAAAWVARRRSPPLYPDAVTLRPDASARAVLAAVDDGPGCSIKDSFASLDLSDDGFHVLFEAAWLHRPSQQRRTRPRLTWRAVRTPDELRAWAAAHGGGDVFRPGLLDDPAVAILMAHDGDELVAGVAGNQTGSTVGLSNLFSLAGDVNQVWSEASDAVAARFPGLDLVGYEQGEYLRAAHRAGFVSVGPLRVWLKPDGT